VRAHALKSLTTFVLKLFACMHEIDVKVKATFQAYPGDTIKVTVMAEARDTCMMLDTTTR